MEIRQQTSFLADLPQVETNPAGPHWLRPIRQAAARRFAELGFPTRRDEEWRFTPIAPIVETPFAPAARISLSTDAIRPYTYDAFSNSRVVIVNGHFAAELSSLNALPKGVQVLSFADALDSQAGLSERHFARYASFENQPFVALNTALFTDGVFISIPRNAVVEQPIHVVVVSTTREEAVISHPRVLIVAGENSQATVIETYAGSEERVYLTNAVTEIVLAENAVVDHYKVQRESAQGYHIATLQVQLARASNFSSHSISLGGAITRNDVNAVVADEGCECTLNGLYMGHDRQLVDNHTFIDHAMPHCNSHELYKGILDGRSRGVFNGKILVRQDAQKTDAKQTNQVLLLSDDAQINTKPQLEIYADDVRCTHGATVGQLSDEALFYLRSRGIPKADARNLLIYAFASDVVSRIKVEPLRAQLDHALIAERAVAGVG
jgi:Fe-S cluster assembly protein SufD